MRWLVSYRGIADGPTVSVAQPQQTTEITDMPWIFFKRLYHPQPLARIIAVNQTRGRMMRRVVLSIASAALMAGAAQAADMPVKAYRAPVTVPAPVFTWTGFYVGANAGGHWSKDELTAVGDPTGFVVAAAAELNARSAGSVSTTGFIGGAQIGYNWQMNRVVLGLEADGNWRSGKASRSITYTGAVTLNPADIMTNSTHGTWLATVRGRAGVTFDRVLLYATGGVAVGEIKTTDTFCSFGCIVAPPGTLASVSGTTTRTGWTAGGGLEYGITNNWSLRAEYLYVDLGSFNTNIPPCPFCAANAVTNNVVVTHKFTDNIGRLGINYRF
jgi:outer membrane immunogenic protein